MKLNIPLLLQVKAHILEEPRRLNMTAWTQSAKPGERVAVGSEFGIWTPASESPTEKLTHKTAPPCGTVGCIAGWAMLLSGKNRGYYASLGSESSVDVSILDTLFYVQLWTNEAHRVAYVAAKRARDRARIVAKVIDEFIAQHGDEV